VFRRAFTFGAPFYQTLLVSTDVQNFDTEDEHLPSMKNFETSFSSMSAFFIMSAKYKEKRKEGVCKRESDFYLLSASIWINSGHHPRLLGVEHERMINDKFGSLFF
jgi:hypothetical protein